MYQNPCIKGETIMYAITILIVAIPSLFLLYRTLYASGIPLPNTGVFGRLTAYRGIEPSNDNVTKKEIITIAVQALCIRATIYFISYLLLILFFNKDESFIQIWSKWDAPNYLGIASGGYDQIKVDDIENMGNGVLSTLAFFPLYPALMRIVDFVLHNMNISALVTSSLCYVGGCIFLYMATTLRYNNKSIAQKVIILLSVFPYAFFFGTMTPESTFLLVGSACMYFTFRRKWCLAGLFGIFCALSRMQGILIVAFLGIEWLEDSRIFLILRKKKWSELPNRIFNLLAVLMPFLGLLIYLYINKYYTGDAFYFLDLQLNVWGHSFENVGLAIRGICNSIISPNTDYDLLFTLWYPQLFLFFSTILLLFIRLRKHSNSLTIYLLIYVVISYSTDYLISGGRYMSIALPLFMILAEFCEKHRMTYIWLIGIGIILQVILLSCHLNGIHLVT